MKARESTTTNIDVTNNCVTNDDVTNDGGTNGGGNGSGRKLSDSDPTPPSTTGPSRESGPARPRAREELLNHSAGRLEAEVIELAGRISVGTYELLVLVGELDLRETWAASGALSCAAWLADTCDIEICTARTQVRVARAMRQFPSLDRAMAEGDISYAKARVLVSYLTEANISDLLDIAERTSAGRLGAAVAAWSQRNDDPETIRRRQFEARSVTWRTEPDGMITVTARLTPEAAGSVCAVVDTVVARNNAPAGASLAQQRADALVGVTTGGGRGRGAVTAEFVVHVREDGNALADGTPLSDYAVAGLLPEAFVSLLMHDLKRYPIDASPRRRFPTRHQKRYGPHNRALNSDKAGAFSDAVLVADE